MRIGIASVCLLLAMALSAVSVNSARPACCHGCEMFTCNTDQCGKTCKLGPKCKGCWKQSCSMHHDAQPDHQS